VLRDVQAAASNLAESLGAQQDRVQAISREILAAPSVDRVLLLRAIEEIVAANAHLQARLAAAQAHIHERAQTLESYLDPSPSLSATLLADETAANRRTPQPPAREAAARAEPHVGAPLPAAPGPLHIRLPEPHEPSRPQIDEALLDKETGLATRTALAQELHRRLAERRRVGGHLAVLLMELTDLADQQRGGRARHDLLAMVATLLRANSREMDLAARYGAGRFALLLPGASLADALSVAERLLAALVVYDDVSVRLLPPRCRWIGGAAVAQDLDEASTLLRRAETALRAASMAGGDQVYAHDGANCAPALAATAACA
jgi:diguanylate cyclase (GGDEF)-like protein